MNLKDKRLKNNLLLATYIVVLAYVLLNLGTIGTALNGVLSIVGPFIVAICIAFVLNIPMVKIENTILKKYKGKGKRGIAILLTFIIIIGIIIGLMVFIIPQLTESVETLAKSIPSYMRSFENMMNEHMSSLVVLDDIWAEVMRMWKEIFQVVGQVTGTLLTQILDITLGLTSTIVNFFLALIFAIYMLASKEKLGLQCKKIIYAFNKEKTADKIMDIAGVANLKFSKFIAGQCIEAVIIGVFCFIAMLIFRMPYALLISTIVGVTAIIPIFGALVGTIPGAFIILMIDPMKAIGFIVLIIVVQQLEGNIIYPKVVGSSIGLSGIWVMFAVLVGGATFGIPGILIGIPLLGVLYTVLGEVVNNKLKKKEILLDYETDKIIVDDVNEKESTEDVDE